MGYNPINVYMGTTYNLNEHWKNHIDHLPEQKCFAGERLNCPKDGFFYYYIKSGLFRMGVEKPDGTVICYAYCRAGATMKINGPFLCMEGFDVPFVEAVENSVICGFSLDELYALIVKDRGVFEDIMNSNSVYSTMLRERLEIISGVSATNRLLTWLDKLCGCIRPDENSAYVIECGMTQQQIADLLCIHVTTCNKLFSKLKTSGIAQHTKKNIYVYRRDLLRSYLNQENSVF